MNKNSTIYTDKVVSKAAIMQFMQKCKENKTDIHSFEILKDGEVKVRIAPSPYSFEYKQQLYSISKSFSSTAVGFLVDDRLVNIDDRVVDIFSEKCPKTIGKNLSKMRLKHLLSMNTGHGRCLLNDIRRSDDPVRLFLEFEPEFEPGTHFLYNNAATYMLSEVVRKYTNMTMFDFLSQRLFEPLEIKGTHWNTYADGNSQGAVGLHASTDDIAKLGLLYLNKGVYDGKRILSESWVNMAVEVWSDNSTNGTADWTVGYGFQFWRNARDGFRGDGAFGQFCMVFPSENMVVAMEVYSDDVQAEINLIYDLIDNLYGESDISDKELSDFVDSYNSPCKYKSAAKNIFGNLYACEENPLGITFVSFSDSPDSIGLNFSDGTKWQTMSFGKEKYCENNIQIKKLKPTLEELAGHNKKENVHFAGYCTFDGNALYMHLNYLDNPHIDDYICEFNKNTFNMKKMRAAEYSYNGEIKGKCV